MTNTARHKRRTLALLRKRLDEAQLFQVADPRGPWNRQWSLLTLLRSVIMGIACGAQNLKDVERLSAEGSPSARRFLGVGARRVPDTTMRDFLCKLTPESLTPALHRLVKAAHRRKALASGDLPLGVLALDGKRTAISGCDDHYAQRQTQSEQSPLVGAVRTVTATLVSSAARPVIDVIPIPASTNEMGYYEHALRTVFSHYSRCDLFRLITYDAGACSAHNGQVTCDLGLHYLFRLKHPHTSLLDELYRALHSLTQRECAAFTEDQNGQQLVRRSLWLVDSSTIVAPAGWEHLRSVLRVRSELLDTRGNVTASNDRYFVSSMPVSRLEPEQWLRIIRKHWGVELAHQTLDQAFTEDDKPWIRSNPQGMLVVAVLRRITFTLLALYRSISLRSESHRAMPWKDLLRSVELALLTATDPLLTGLRKHRVVLIE